MHPLNLVALGIAVVALDFRLQAIDLLPDVAGWILVGVGLWQSGQRATVGIAVPCWFAVTVAVAAHQMPRLRLARPRRVDGRRRR